MLVGATCCSFAVILLSYSLERGVIIETEVSSVKDVVGFRSLR